MHSAIARKPFVPLGLAPRARPRLHAAFDAGPQGGGAGIGFQEPAQRIDERRERRAGGSFAARGQHRGALRREYEMEQVLPGDDPDDGRSEDMPLAKGNDSLPRAIASRIDVRLEAPVQALEANSDGVTVRLAGETLGADAGGFARTGVRLSRLAGAPRRYSLHVNGPWCITFEWIDGDAWRVDLQQYH